jgi:hypothetical protein
LASRSRKTARPPTKTPRCGSPSRSWT